MRVGLLRERLAAAIDAAMRTREAEAIALTADRTKAMAVALAGFPRMPRSSPRGWSSRRERPASCSASIPSTCDA